MCFEQNVAAEDFTYARQFVVTRIEIEPIDRIF
jgi:hypothetical protein